MKQNPSIPPSLSTRKATFSPPTIKQKWSTRQPAVQPNIEHRFPQEHSSSQTNILHPSAIPLNINPLHDKTTTEVPTSPYLNNLDLKSHPCTQFHHQQTPLMSLVFVSPQKTSSSLFGISQNLVFSDLDPPGPSFPQTKSTSGLNLKLRKTQPKHVRKSPSFFLPYKQSLLVKLIKIKSTQFWGIRWLPSLLLS